MEIPSYSDINKSNAVNHFRHFAKGLLFKTYMKQRKNTIPSTISRGIAGNAIILSMSSAVAVV